LGKSTEEKKNKRMKHVPSKKSTQNLIPLSQFPLLSSMLVRPIMQLFLSQGLLMVSLTEPVSHFMELILY